MSTTSQKLPAEVKRLLAASAAEKRAAFAADAAASRAETLKSGKGYSLDEVQAYIEARVRGKNVPKPKARSFRD